MHDLRQEAGLADAGLTRDPEDPPSSTLHQLFDPVDQEGQLILPVDQAGVEPRARGLVPLFRPHELIHTQRLRAALDVDRLHLFELEFAFRLEEGVTTHDDLVRPAEAFEAGRHVDGEAGKPVDPFLPVHPGP